MQTLRFILVHGTFKPKAAWTLENSPLASAIVTTFERSVIERFVWDGKNSIRSRVAAVQSLSARLTELRKTEPDVRVVVIAHSHGGNIAFDAIAHSPICENVAAVVTLGTPFFEFLPRESGNATVYAVSLALGASSALYVGVAILLNHLGLQAALSALVAVVFFVGLTVTLRKKLHRSEGKAVKWLGQFPRRHDVGDLPVLCIRFGLDEARLWLILLGLVRKLDKGVARRARKYVSLATSGFGFAAIALSIIVFGSVNPEDTFGPLLLRVISMFVAVAAICILLLALLSPLAVFASFIATHRFGFGGQPGLTALQFDLNVNTVPASGRLYPQKFSTVSALARGLFASGSVFTTPHALGYTDRKSIEFLCQWVKRMLPMYRHHRDA